MRLCQRVLCSSLEVLVLAQKLKPWSFWFLVCFRFCFVLLQTSIIRWYDFVVWVRFSSFPPPFPPTLPSPVKQLRKWCNAEAHCLMGYLHTLLWEEWREVKRNWNKLLFLLSREHFICKMSLKTKANACWNHSFLAVWVIKLTRKLSSNLNYNWSFPINTNFLTMLRDQLMLVNDKMLIF